ncbi:hypothetical protein BGW38_005826 [Lunasporangiospora selenospora]|uniref:Secreted protein n=1 Tax=Lunasporangiospora selenospora TaxID=979761 RepID=A0A9P6G2W0_9FUNG|nr:hypothetical protein BGW38_005826 [Lunasporangiospora selenospora]
MRFTTIAAVAAVAAVAQAQITDYPFPANAPCIQGCIDKVGKAEFADFSMDPANPNFMASLAFISERGTPRYSAFMGKTGPCMMSCTQQEQDDYRAAFDKKVQWYLAKKAELAGKNNTKPDTANPNNKTSSANTMVASGLAGAAAFVGAVVLF